MEQGKPDILSKIGLNARDVGWPDKPRTRHRTDLFWILPIG